MSSENIDELVRDLKVLQALEVLEEFRSDMLTQTARYRGQKKQEILERSLKVAQTLRGDLRI